ncbi:MAG: tRNA adenosine(34) deaminase TadA [Candidatus Nanopelagicales bacterium]|nr:tRNA adenosine(34) deaminase TadA [Candidatus Nanopelagicales bacterium]MCF8538308.1 tRNA adenosine(34) deaminase TadA [Candidatus Nanopelagicales bacterium]MCF8543337.1 tRNA adenosine(34) deaminase TadA [Candidatus Nanopelagicales bacterium]MCF8556747.1 tRNA adenosine(34) deaminase TadA [Candidatus Nanopelagicales bacterium]
MTPQHFEASMRRALAQAEQAAAEGEIPIGAVVLDSQGNVLASAHNSREASHDPTAHAEVLALRAAAERQQSWRLDGCTLVVTLEPCPMCAGAAVMSRIGTLVFGAWNDEYGAAGSRWDLVRDRRLNHQVEVFSGVLADECGAMVREFLDSRRMKVTGSEEVGGVERP